MNTTRRLLIASAIFLISLGIPLQMSGLLAPTVSGQGSSNIDSISQNNQTYGTGLSGAPVIMDESAVTSMTGGPTTVAAIETAIEEYLVPIGVNLVFIDIGWGNGANTSTTEVAGGYQQWVANWLEASEVFGIQNIFFVKQFGYFFAAPSWDQDFLDAYPQAETVNSSGVYVPLTSGCAGCLSSSGWSISNPLVLLQYEQDLKQLYTWYGNYTNWIGFGEGATGDRNNYADSGTSIKTERAWDNGTISQFANSIFFQRNINMTTGEYSDGQLSDVWSMFLQDQPDEVSSSGPSYLNDCSYGTTGQMGVFSTSDICQHIYGRSIYLARFFVPWNATLNGFTMSAFLGTQGSPSTSLYEAIYPDNTSIPFTGSPVLDDLLENESVSGIPSSTHGAWVTTSFHTTLIGGNYYWIGFTTSGGNSNDFYYVMTYADQILSYDLYNYGGSLNNEKDIARGQYGGILWLKSLSGQNITIYPDMDQIGANWKAIPGNYVYFEVPQTSQANSIQFSESDRAYDPNNITLYVEYPNNTKIAQATFGIFQRGGWSQPYQLNQTVTLYPGIKYHIDFSALPTTDNYAGNSGGGITQDFIEEEANPATAGYLGQQIWPSFNIGMMQVLNSSVSNPQYGSTDLAASPNYQPGAEIALRFQPSESETLQSFSLEFVKADSSSNVLNVTLRSDNETCPTGISGTCSHPDSVKAPVLAHGTESMRSINSSFTSCAGEAGDTGDCAFADVTFTGVSGTTGTSLTAGTYYWLVMNVSGNQYVKLQRLVNPWTALVYYIPSEPIDQWYVPADGPTDLSYTISTSVQSIAHSVLGADAYSFGGATWIAQSFESPKDIQIKGIILDTNLGEQSATIRIETDSGSNSPSGATLATGTWPLDSSDFNLQSSTPLTYGDSVSFSPGSGATYEGGGGVPYFFEFPTNITANTKYWIVINSSCQIDACHSPTYAYVLEYSQGDGSSAYGGGDYQALVSTNSGSTWGNISSIADLGFVMIGTDSTVHVYNTTELSSEIMTDDDNSTTQLPLVGWNSFLNYEQTNLMENLTHIMNAYSGRTFYWYNSMSVAQYMDDYNSSTSLTASSGAGGPLGCDPSSSTTSCESQGSSPTFWIADGGDEATAILESPNQNNLMYWSSFGSTPDNQGDLNPSDLYQSYIYGVPLTARNPILFNDWTWSVSEHGLNNVSMTSVPIAFNTILSRMQYNGGYYGTQKDAVKVLWIGTSGDGVFPTFLEPAVNVTEDYEDYSLSNVVGPLSQYNVIVTDPSIMTASADQEIANFVKNGGGLVVTDFGASPDLQDNMLGLSSSSSAVSATSSNLKILSSNPITNPYNSISFSPYYLKYKVSSLSNESAQTLVEDSYGNPVITVNNYFNGRGVSLEQGLSRLSNTGNGLDSETLPRDSWISLLINAIYYAAGKQNMLPILWESSYSSQQNWGQYTQFSIDGSPGKPVLLWLTSNATTSTPFELNLNASFYNISTQGWIAINMENMSVIAQGSGSNIEISTMLPPQTWLPIYIMNDTSSSNVQPIYSTASIVSSSTSAGSESFQTSSPANSSNWLIFGSSSPISSVSSSLVGSMSSLSTLSSLNATDIGDSCTSVSNDACTSFTSYNQQGWYFDSTNSLLYIHYEGSASTSLSIYSNSITPSTTTSTTAGSSTSTSTESSSSHLVLGPNSSTTSSSTSTPTTTSATSEKSTESILSSLSTVSSTSESVKSSIATTSEATNYQVTITATLPGENSSSSAQSSTGSTSSGLDNSTLSYETPPVATDTKISKTSAVTSSSASSIEISASLTEATSAQQANNNLSDAALIKSDPMVSSARSGIITYEVALIALAPLAIRLSKREADPRKNDHGWQW